MNKIVEALKQTGVFYLATIDGDPEHGIPPGTRFEDLPADWRCPRCRQSKDKFGKA